MDTGKRQFPVIDVLEHVYRVDQVELTVNFGIERLDPNRKLRGRRLASNHTPCMNDEVEAFTEWLQIGYVDTGSMEHTGEEPDTPDFQHPIVGAEPWLNQVQSDSRLTQIDVHLCFGLRLGETRLSGNDSCEILIPNL